MKRSELYLVTAILFLIGFWLHIPYGGGHIFSDIPTLFQQRECGGACLAIPYVNSFVEYPIVVSEFIYTMGAIAKILPGSILTNYYYLTVAFLAIPTFLLIHETLKIAEMRGYSDRRVLAYLIATPTFLFMLLLNWYVIGVYFATFGLRKFLQGNYKMSGILFGLSAASNLVTATPAMGMFLAAKGLRDRAVFLVSALACYGAINLPFIVVNPSLWLSFWQFHANWYIEGSWMLAFLPSLSPLRHYIFPALLLSLYAAISWISLKKAKDAVTLSWLSTFAFLFSTYVFTPQMNLMLLPFFVITPIIKRYWEFLAFDAINSLFVVLGFSQFLLIFGITYQFDVVSYLAPVRWLAIARSIWLGKMLLFDSLLLVINWTRRIRLNN
ncbi:MAG: hypothetical protein LYZ69_08770 [Nitrososphaerales archaeon]|nr:hypothetical protein [Nitrososphaerales archaeon]